MYPFTFIPRRSKDGARAFAENPLDGSVFTCAFDTLGDTQASIDTISFFDVHVLFYV